VEVIFTKIRNYVNVIKAALAIDDWKEMQKYTLILSAIYLVGFYPMLRANVYYKDDMDRAVSGGQGWSYYSRWITMKLSSLIHAGLPLTDVSPLTQILAILFIGLAGVVIIFVFCDKQKITIWHLLAVVPMTFSPYFLECISYKYDAPYMALSVLASVFPFVYVEKSNFTFVTISFLGVLTMCCTYQSSSGIYALVAVFYWFHKWIKGCALSYVLKKLGVSFVVFASALSFYKVFLLTPLKAGYVDPNVSESVKILSVFTKNVSTYFSLLKSDNIIYWQVLVLMLVIAYVSSLTISSARNKVLTIIIGILLVAVSSIASYGVFLILNRPLFEPRGMYGIGVLLAIISVNAIGLVDNNFPAKVLCFAFSWCLFIFVCTYGNALFQQQHYQNLRTALLLQDLNHIPLKKPPQALQIQGSIGYAPVVQLMMKKYPVLKRLIVPLGEMYGSEYYIYYHLNLSGFKMTFKRQQDFKKLELKPIIQTRYHTIKSNDKCVLVVLH
jgi:hypothetical protein